jgi:ABC-type antimicrobial peptide transport system permease subunit
MRTTGDPAAVAAAVRQTMRAFDAAIPTYDLRTMTDIRADSMSERRFLLLLVGMFGVVALMLAAVGIYGVMALAVSERRTELGVRLALGATPSSVLSLVLGHAVRLSLVALAIGLGASLILGPLMTAHLFGIAATDVTTFAATSALLLIVAAIAAWIPARRAMAVDPVATLRG